MTSSPDGVAVKDAAGSLTYAELSARADRVARHLVGLGVTPGELVAICLERSASLLVAALGIFRAGAAYVATDPAYPEERLRWMLRDSAPVATVADRATADRLGGVGPTVVLSPGGRLDPAAPDDPSVELPPPPGPDDLAYVVYTSGSTGRPKGAMIDHAGLANLVGWHRRAFDLGADDRCTQFVSPGFDAAVLEIWPALASGAALHVVPPSLRADPVGLRDWLAAERITFTTLPTAVAETVIGLTWPRDARLRRMLIGGDALTRRPPAASPFTLVNSYGVSEASVVSTAGEVDPDGEGPPSIGRPIDGVAVEILGEDLEPLPLGATGELAIVGPSVGRGYLNQPGLTAERFFEDRRGRRLYRTGDRARIAADGEVEFLGRLDDQLSIRGFRVEAGEVAAALNSHPGVEASVAVAAGDSSAERRLVAYLVAAGPERPGEEEVSEFVARSLPEYMVPSTYVWLDRLPVTEHGKVDREALPEPTAASPGAPAGAAAEPPATDVEATIAGILAELLEVAAVEPDQSFLELGGHSLVAAQTIMRIEELYGAEVGLRFLFEHPTPAELAKEVERQIEAGAEPPRAIAAFGSPPPDAS
ncbi:MAG TPA: non-ribosomal peptide synthetase [Solirubrobacterales bacterium]|nr:non-ribosomal peptide synthetase [Solirubrobacterales bacterium]